MATEVAENNMAHTRKLDVYKKVDTTKNGDALNYMNRQREKEKTLFTLKITDRITILVTKEKCNDEYRQEWISRNNIENPPKNKPMAIEEEKLKELLIEKGMTVNEAADELNYTATTVYKYAKIYNIKPTSKEQNWNS